MILPEPPAFRISKFLIIILTVAITGSTVAAQATRAKNNPYSPSPVGVVKGKRPTAIPIAPTPNETVSIVQGASNTDAAEDHSLVAQPNFGNTKTVALSPLPLSEIYRVGVGDVLFVGLKNSAQGSRQCTVQSNGMIDFPLAGGNLIVVDQTVSEIEAMLGSRITLFRNPQVEIRVREFNSHKITVSGTVENPGERSLQREAIPLFVIRSEAAVNSQATKAVVKRAPLVKLETYDLSDADTDNVLIYPGNSVEFIAEKFYYIGGDIISAGKKDLTQGLTLSQAIAASGGVKGDPKKAFIRRKNEKGAAVNVEYNLRDIKKGKAADPPLTVADVIEIRK